MKHDLNCLKKSMNVRMRVLDGKYYLFGNGLCFELNEIGALTWKYIDENITTSEFCSKVGLKYKEEDIEKIEKDVNDFLNLLIDKRMVETCE